MKLFEGPLLNQYYTGAERVLQEGDYNAALSPQELTKLRHDSVFRNSNPQIAERVAKEKQEMASNASLKPSLNPASLQPNSVLEEVPDYTIKHVHGEKDEIYSLGITLLSASSNNPISEFYDYKHMDINRGLIQKKLALMNQHQYHPQLIQLVQAMLEENPDKRIGLAQVMSVVSQPKKELTKEDIFELPANKQATLPKAVHSQAIAKPNNQPRDLSPKPPGSLNPQHTPNRQLLSASSKPVVLEQQLHTYEDPGQQETRFRLPQMEGLNSLPSEEQRVEITSLRESPYQAEPHNQGVEKAGARHQPTPQSSQLPTPRGGNPGFLNSNPNSNKLREPQMLVHSGPTYGANPKAFPFQSGLKNLHQSNNRFY